MFLLKQNQCCLCACIYKICFPQINEIVGGGKMHFALFYCFIFQGFDIFRKISSFSFLYCVIFVFYFLFCFVFPQTCFSHCKDGNMQTRRLRVRLFIGPADNFTHFQEERVKDK